MQRKLLHLTVFVAMAALLGGCASAQPFQGMDAEEVYRAGVEAYEAEDWDLAISAFERLLFSVPSFDRAPNARLQLARAFYNKEEYITAASEFSRFLDRYPTHELAPRASLGNCRAYVELSPIVQRDQTYTREAYRACRRTATEHAGTDAGREAVELRDRMHQKLARKVLIGGEFYLSRQMYDSAIIYFTDVVENYPETGVVPRALKGLVDANTAIGYRDEAEDARQRLLEEYPDSQAAQEVREVPADGDDGGGAPSDTTANAAAPGAHGGDGGR